MDNLSGKFVLRLKPQLHANLKNLAQKRGLSLNQLCTQLIELGLTQNQKNLPIDRLQKLSDKIKKRFSNVLGVLVFGSYVKSEQFENSDIDLLIVLDKKNPIHRDLYTIWDQDIEDSQLPMVSPHFTQLPNLKNRPSSLWLEVANAHEIIWQKNQKLQNYLNQINQWIAMGRVHLKTSHGQPYWVWEAQNA